MRILALAALAAAIGFPAFAAETGATLAVGATMPIALQENLTTGHAWRVDDGSSKGLGSVVAIVDKGHPSVGDPGHRAGRRHRHLRL